VQTGGPAPCRHQTLPDLRHIVIPIIHMAPRRPSTIASDVSALRTNAAPYPQSRPVSRPRSMPGTGRPRTARPRTAASTIGTDTNVIAAVTEGMATFASRTDEIGRGIATSVGVCFLSLDTGECILSQVSLNLECGNLNCQISDSQTYGKTIHKLAIFDPIEV